MAFQKKVEKAEKDLDASEAKERALRNAPKQPDVTFPAPPIVEGSNE